jgi:hypothetical protein
VVVSTFTLANPTTTNCNIANIELTARQGDVHACNSYALMAVSATGVKALVANGTFAPGPQGSVVDFIMAKTVPAGTTQSYEVDAITAPITSSASSMLQASINPMNIVASEGGKTLDDELDIFDLLGDDPCLIVGNTIGGDLG